MKARTSTRDTTPEARTDAVISGGGFSLEGLQSNHAGRSPDGENGYLRRLGSLLSPRGRASRRFYWTYVGVEATIWIVFAATVDALDLDLFEPQNRPIAVATLVAVAASLLMGVLVGIRRLHDQDRGGWWLALFFLPLVGWAMAATMLGRTPGTPGPNRFGPNPVESGRT